MSKLLSLWRRVGIFQKRDEHAKWAEEVSKQVDAGQGQQGPPGVQGPPGAPGAPGPDGGAILLSSTYGSPGTVSVNDAVYITGDNAVDQADASSIATMPAIGFVSSKPTAVTAIVQYYGELGGFVGLVAGDTYYMDTTPGEITNDVSLFAPGQVIQKVGFARNPTTLVVQVDRDFTTLS